MSDPLQFMDYLGGVTFMSLEVTDKGVNLVLRKSASVIQRHIPSIALSATDEPGTVIAFALMDMAAKIILPFDPNRN